MLFMNIARKFGSVFMDVETGGEGAAAGGAAAETGAEAGAEVEKAGKVTLGEPEAKPEVTPEKVTEEPGAVEDNGMQQYIDQYQAENPALGLALGFLRDAGISPTDPAFQLAEVEGDFELLKATLAAKALPGTDAMVAILEKAVASHFEAVEKAEAETTALVTEILGEQKDEVLEWARSTASDEEKTAFNDMLEAGGVYARAAAVLLREAFQSSGNTIPAKHAVETATPGAVANGPLTAREFAAETEKLARKLGGDPRGSAEYAQIQRRREAGRKRGI
ncbi:hypothetical protein [Kosakonia virus Kc318]|uniref:Scaffolding protein n=1 Tax=Kosakonia virus Kc318 TaxID=2797327 RepID=A0AAE7PCX4_9CAUD|nr:hypothetical protein [Kosakonia virus Kc318]